VRSGFTDALFERMHRPDSPVRLIPIAYSVAKNADGSNQAAVRQKRDDWALADGAAAGPPPTLTGFDLLDNGDVRLHDTVTTLLSKAGPPNSYLTPLTRTFPLHVAMIEWGGTESPDIELKRIKIWLNPRTGAATRQVVKWKLDLYALIQEVNLGGGLPHTLYYGKIVDSVVVDVTNDAEGLVTFDYSGLTVLSRPKPKFSNLPRQIGVPTFNHPTTFLAVTALDKDGNGAGNVGMGIDTGTPNAASGGNILSSRQILAVASGAAGDGRDGGADAGCPIITIDYGTYTSATINFTTNPLNLGSAPTGDVQLIAKHNVPAGCSVVTRIRNDADSAFVPYTDGQWMIADLGLTPSTTRKWQVDLNTNVAGGSNLTPTLREIGMEALTELNFVRQTKITGGDWAIDPRTMKGEIPEITITAIRDGDRDYADAITELLANNHIADIRFRLYWGDEGLARKDWGHVDDFFIDGSHPRGASISLKCLTPLCLLRDSVPRFKPGSAFPPDGDWVVGAWTTESGGGAPLYTHINEAVFDDTTWIQSELTPSNSAYEMTLPTFTDPTGRRHILDYRFRKSATGGEQIDLTFEYRQGTTVIASITHVNIDTDAALSATAANISLTDAQVAQITNYPDIRVRINANKISGAGARRAVVTWCVPRTAGKQDQVTYNTTLKGVYDGLIANELGIDARYRGPGVEDIQAINQVAKTMFETSSVVGKPLGKGELDSIAYIAGGGLISSQGKITFRDMFSPGPVRAIFPSQEITLDEAGPGYEERMPQLFVQWRWNPSKGDFDRQEYVVHAGALLHLGKARLDGPSWVDAETAKWFANEGLDSKGVSLAGRVGVRQVQALGPGLMLWPFVSNYRQGHLEPGDVVLLQTDKFVGRDPNVARALKGQVWVIGVIQSVSVDAQHFKIWVRNYSDMLATSDSGDRLGLGPATPHITSVTPSITDAGSVTAIVACNAATAVRIAVSTSAEPSAATVRAAALQTLDSAGVIRTAALGALTTGQTLYIAVLAYERVDGSGLESPLGAAKILFGPPAIDPPYASGAFSHSGLSAFDATKVWNYTFDDQAWHTDTAVSGAWLKLDAGSAKDFVECRIYNTQGAYLGVYDIEYSDDNAAWSLASANFNPTAIGLNSRRFLTVGAHRYWRIKLTNTPGTGSWLAELNFIEKTFGRFQPFIQPPMMLDGGNERAVKTIVDGGGTLVAAAKLVPTNGIYEGGVVQLLYRHREEITVNGADADGEVDVTFSQVYQNAPMILFKGGQYVSFSQTLGTGAGAKHRMRIQAVNVTASGFKSRAQIVNTGATTAQDDDFPAADVLTAAGQTTVLSLNPGGANDDTYNVQYFVSVTLSAPGVDPNVDLTLAIDTDDGLGGGFVERATFHYSRASAGTSTWTHETKPIAVTGLLVANGAKIRLRAKSFVVHDATGSFIVRGGDNGATDTFHGVTYTTAADTIESAIPTAGDSVLWVAQEVT
jgi:hypothetical protein